MPLGFTLGLPAAVREFLEQFVPPEEKVEREQDHRGARLGVHCMACTTVIEATFRKKRNPNTDQLVLDLVPLGAVGGGDPGKPIMDPELRCSECGAVVARNDGLGLFADPEATFMEESTMDDVQPVRMSVEAYLARTPAMPPAGGRRR
ncbi:hypothetical protein PAPYR_13444 [Paratrimastix pyriformis]|uniref:Uncharacterized protein n=1 Tax=Paratrimastix pyriformis TaxID=342808 RepID=A0ABQ8U4D4_9EUKA|nr:hypothetical protein PAPYR_13444 [Paratrimastix pyriformis]